MVGCRYHVSYWETESLRYMGSRDPGRKNGPSGLVAREDICDVEASPDTKKSHWLNCSQKVSSEMSAGYQGFFSHKDKVSESWPIARTCKIVGSSQYGNSPKYLRHGALKPGTKESHSLIFHQRCLMGWLQGFKNSGSCINIVSVSCSIAWICESGESSQYGSSQRYLRHGSVWPATKESHSLHSKHMSDRAFAESQHHLSRTGGQRHTHLPLTLQLIYRW
jgi:hypothetical protein